MRIRRLTLDDMPACLELAVKRDWPAEALKWRMILELGAGFGVDSPEGGLAGTVLITPYGREAASIGMMAVSPSHGRQGLGRRLMEHALEHIGPIPTLLFATDQGRPLYEKLGFVQVDEIVKHVGRLTREPQELSVPDTRVRAMTAEDLDAVATLDAGAFGAPRHSLLHALYRVALRALVAERGGRVVGYGLAWPNLDSTMVGPLIAQEEPIAWVLAAELLRGLEGVVRIDIPPRFVELSEWVAGRGLERHVPSPMMMLHGTQAPGKREHLYAIAAQALG
ncbi:GNAT family N-acetyltransferase [Archangium lansingense]|uniref:GNAT family N-acetyltransferase n=1 Tax=Archangium lansingense TaxID=2995310 RepID=A0ABT4AE34_9BACT|nr:GNAT family N-acetyltransferase [Archangium lansinium]MCY1079179.1 GNAT family N-acetyltransferase [Archangium lansinium]